MKILDPKRIQESILRHTQLMQQCTEVGDKREASAKLLSQIERVKETVKNLDGSELATLKRELQQLYELSVHAQVAHGQAQNFQIGNSFVIRLHEQEQLMLWELKTQLIDALGAMKAALHQKDFMQLFLCLGGIMGAVN